MDNQNKIEDILGRIAEGKHTDSDLNQLRELLSASDSESLIQLGKNIVGKIDGRDIQIGDRIYQGIDAETIQVVLRSVFQEMQISGQQPLGTGEPPVVEEHILKQWRCLWSFSSSWESVFSVAVSPNGQTMASGSNDGEIRLWNLKNGELVCILSGHFNIVKAVAFSPDGQIIASGSYDKTVRVWHLSSRRLLYTFGGFISERLDTVLNGFLNLFSIDQEGFYSNLSNQGVAGHSDDIFTLAFTPNGRFLASGSLDKTIKIWDLATGKLYRTLVSSGAIGSIAISSDGDTLASNGRGTVLIWSLRTGELRSTLFAHGEAIDEVAFSPDGKTLATSSGGTIKLWQMETERLCRTFGNHSDGISSLAFSPDGQILASCSWDATVKLWIPSTGNLIKTFYASQGTHIQRGGVRSVAFSPDSKILVSGSRDPNEIKVWQMLSVEESEHLRQMEESHERQLANVSLVNTLLGHSDEITSVAISPDRQTLASTGADNTIRIWSLGSGEVTHIHNIYQDSIRNDCTGFVAFTSDGQTLVSCNRYHPIQSWNLQTGELVSTITEASDPVIAIAISSNSSMLVTSHHDKKLKIWSLDDGKLIRTISGSYNERCTLAISPDDRTLLSGGKGYNAIQILDLNAGDRVRTLSWHSGAVKAITISPDGQTFASNDEDTINIWDCRTGDLQHILSEYSGNVCSISISSDGQTLASGSSNGTINLWNLQTGKLLHSLSEHSTAVKSLCFSSDARFLVSGSSDRSIKIWQVVS